MGGALSQGDSVRTLVSSPLPWQTCLHVFRTLSLSGPVGEHVERFAMHAFHIFTVDKVPLTEADKASYMAIIGVQAVSTPICGAWTTGGRPGLFNRPHLLSVRYYLEYLVTWTVKVT